MNTLKIKYCKDVELSNVLYKKGNIYEHHA